MKTNPMVNNISVIIATKNRASHFDNCLNKILKSVEMPLEIIVVDQSTNSKTRKLIFGENIKLIKYFHLNSKGKSKSLNYAISKAKGKIIAFTDDDCLVDKNWIKNINKTFNKHKNISLCFGKTLPYKSKQHKKAFCPCTFKKNPDKFGITEKPGPHWENVGFGNNMAIKTKVLKKIGLFKEWLGPGSIGSNAEDAEIINRSLINGYKIGYEPTMLVYHNKWLNEEKKIKQEWSYSCGGMACYGYFSFNGNKFAKKIVISELKNGLRSIINFDDNSTHIFKKALMTLTSQIAGLSVASAIHSYEKIFR